MICLRWCGLVGTCRKYLKESRGNDFVAVFVEQINQLEKDRDVVGQLQAIAAMIALPRPSFAISTALNTSLIDSKVKSVLSYSCSRSLKRFVFDSIYETSIDHCEVLASV